MNPYRAAQTRPKRDAMDLFMASLPERDRDGLVTLMQQNRRIFWRTFWGTLFIVLTAYGCMWLREMGVPHGRIVAVIAGVVIGQFILWLKRRADGKDVA